MSRRSGMLVKVDDLGRVVLPKHLRDQMGLQRGDTFLVDKQDAYTLILHRQKDGDEKIDDVINVLQKINRQSEYLKANPELANLLKNTLLETICEINAIEINEES